MGILAVKTLNPKLYILMGATRIVDFGADW